MSAGEEIEKAKKTLNDLESNPAALEKFANRKWAATELGSELLPDVADAGLDEDEEAPPAGLMEFMAENRFLNGTNETLCGRPPGSNVFIRLREVVP